MTAILDAILDFLEAPGDCPGLLVVCFSAYIPGPILKKSNQIVMRNFRLLPNALGLTM